MPEKVLPYGLVAARTPQRVLEIGSFLGGSALIIVAALGDVGGGRVWRIDVEPRVAGSDWARSQHRAARLAKASPEALEDARRDAGAGLDSALIDSDHSFAEHSDELRHASMVSHHSTLDKDGVSGAVCACCDSGAMPDARRL